MFEETNFIINKNWNNFLYFYLEDKNGINIGRIGTNLYFYKELNSNREICKITYFIIKKEYRGLGYGKYFLQSSLEWLKKMGYHKIKIIIEEDSQRWGKLEKYYKERGFIKSGNENIKYNGDVLYRYLPMEFFLSRL